MSKTFWKSVTGSLSGSLTTITTAIQNETPRKVRSYEESDDVDLKQIYSGCHLLLKEYLQEGEKSKHTQFWQSLRDSLTSLLASADIQELTPLGRLHEDSIVLLDRMIALLLDLKAASKMSIVHIESQVALKQLPFEKENTFSLQFAQKVIDLYFEPLQESIKNGELDRSEFEIRQNKFFVEEGEKSRLQKEEYRRIEGLEEDSRHEIELKNLQTFCQQLIDKENSMHEHHKSGGSSDRVLEELATQNTSISVFLKQREQDLLKAKAKRSEILVQREVEEKKKKERLEIVGNKVKERIEWLEFSLKQYKAVLQERETFIKCLSCISNGLDRFVTTLNESIDAELRSVVEKQVERINDYLTFLDQRIQAKTKDIDYLKAKIITKNGKHASALERDDQADARKLKETIGEYTLKLQQSEAVLKESTARTSELRLKLEVLTNLLATNV